MTDLWTRSATELSLLLREREVSPVELLQHLLDRCDSLNDALNAIVTFDREGALAAARASEARYAQGRPLGPLDGIPITVKDNIFVRGLRATWGSRLYRNFVPDQDDIPVARLRKGGAVIVGKTNTPEFAISGHTDNRLFGVTRNPWDLALTPGGSSGGASASVASGMTPLALATDAGGSIRRPASYTGIVGFRPSTGRVARHFGFPALAADFQVIGPLARTVADAGLMFGVIAGPASLDRASFAAQAASQGARRRTSQQRILYVPRVGDAPVDPEILEATDAAADVFRKLGFLVDEAPAPFSADEVNECFATLSGVGLLRVVEQHADWRTEIDPALIPMIEAAAKVTASQYAVTLDRVNALRARFLSVMQEVDFILTPTSAAMPWPAEERFPAKIDGQKVGPRAAGVYVTIANVIGHPAISLPARGNPSQLPIGIQLIGRFGEDDLLLDVARAYEALPPTLTFRPPSVDLPDVEPPMPSM